ncbi:ABC transporter ATP-binding protein [Sulfuricystis multivorans]|uniref:ABC transporter ATP-binding protein n=1 Tax=Sulfuricystis multivorans TaxID=2211108 RepID=UPI000F82393B|nr:ABC transporter ATP-binding protein [Sulfuricystis multivorans]
MELGEGASTAQRSQRAAQQNFSQAPILETRQIAVSVGLHKVCLALDLDLSPGSRLAILGRNGAGKTTLLATLAGLRKPERGTLLLEGKPYEAWNLREAARRRGYLPQAQTEPFAATVLQTVLIGRHPYLSKLSWESAQDIAIAREALARLGLAGFEEREIHTLSGGEWQRVRIASLLAQQPRLYLLDEPCAHLDLNHQIAVLELFFHLAREEGAAVAMVLHDPNLAARFCDQALLLYGDSRHRIGPCEEILSAPVLSELYGHPLCRLASADFSHPVFVPR